MRNLRRFMAVLLAAVVALTAAGLPLPAQAASSPFHDVIGGPYDEAVGTLNRMKIVNGRTATTYAPADPVTRAEMAALLVRALGKADEAARYQGQVVFRDVAGSYWASGVVVLSNQLGLVRGGTDGRFRPGDPVSYKEAATMLVRAAGYEGFVTGDWPTGHILKAKELGMLEGTRFEMDDAANRGDVALMIYNLVFKVPHPASQKTLNQVLYKVPASIKLYPEGEHVAVGQTRVRATVLDAAGRELEIAATLAAAGGTLSAGRLNVAAGTAAVTLRAVAGEIAASRTYKVVSDLKVEPAESVVPPGGKVTLRATAAVAGTSARETVRPLWSVSGDAIIDDAGVVEVSANATSNVIVTAGLGDVEALARVNVATSLSITPANPVAAPGSPLSLSVSLPGGGAVSGVTWTASGGATVSTNGAFTAPSPGQYTVTARLGTTTGSVQVLVPDTLTIDPSRAALQPGAAQKFRATARFGAGTPVAVNASWSVTGNVGTISSAGDLTASALPASGQVNAAFGNLRASAPVSVAGQAARLQMSLSDTTLPADGTATAKLTVRLVDASGNVVPQNQPVTLTQSGAGVTLSSTVAMTQQGEAVVDIRAGTSPGTATITAQSGTLQSGTAVVTLFAAVQPAAKIKLTATPAMIGTTGVQSLIMPTVTATLVDGAGNPVAATTSYNVSLTLLGTGALVNTAAITIPAGASSAATAVYVNPANAGAISITGTSTISVEATFMTLTTAGPAAKVQVVPTRSNAPADGTTTIPVDVYVVDAAGVLRTQDSNIPVTLIVLNAAGGTVTCGTCTGTAQNGKVQLAVPGQTVAGTYTLRAVAGNSLPSVSDVTVTFGASGGTGGSAGPATGLEIVVAPSVPAVGNAATVQVRVKDAGGNVVTSDNGRSITLLATAGSALVLTPGSGNSGTAATVNGVATFTIYSSTVQTASLYANATDLTNPVATGSVTWSLTGIPGTGNRLRLSVTDGVTTRPAQSVFTIKVEVVDANNNLVTSDNGRVIYLTPNPALVTLYNSHVVTSGGQATFTLQSTGAGTVSFTALSNDGLSSPPPALVITFYSSSGTGTTPAKLKLVPSTTNPAAGATVTLTAQVLDANNNLVGSDNGRVIRLFAPSLTGHDATASTTSGQATFVVSGGISGTTYTLWAYSDTLPISEAITLTYGGTGGGTGTTAAKIRLLATTATNVSLGQRVTLKAQVLDANNNLVTSDNGRSILLSAPSGVGLLGSSTRTTINGEVTFEVYPTTAATHVIQAYSISPTTLMAEQTVTVVGSGSAPTTAVKMVEVWDRSTVAANQAATLLVYMADVSNRVVWTDTGRVVSLTTLAGAANLSPAAAFSTAGAAMFTVTPTTPDTTLVLSATTPNLGTIYPSILVTSGTTGGGGSTTGYKVKLVPVGTSVRYDQPLSLYVGLYDASDTLVTSTAVQVSLILPAGVTGNTLVQTGTFATLTLSQSLGNQQVTISGMSTVPVLSTTIMVTN